MSAKYLWLVVLHDRHCDDQFVACKTPETAIKAAQEFMDSYDGRYDWKKEDEYEILARLEPGKFGHRHDVGFDDGPSLHVERVEYK